MKIFFFILVIITVSFSKYNYLQRCNTEYSNGKFYNCSHGVIADANLKVGRLEGDKCDRCNPGMKYAIEYLNKTKKLEVCVPAEFQEDVSFKKDVEICGNLTVKGEIIGIPVCVDIPISFNPYCWINNCTNDTQCFPLCGVYEISNDVEEQCFRDNCTGTEWCIPVQRICAMVSIKETICARDSCTGVVLCNCSGCAEQQIYFVENTTCSGNTCSVSCEEGDTPFGITCNGTDGLDKVFSEGSTAFCNDIVGVSSVGTFCWKYLDENFNDEFIYKVDAFCDNQGNPSCTASCNGSDIAIGVECIMTNALIGQNYIDGSDATCRIDGMVPPFAVNMSAICMSSEYAVKCNETASPSRVGNSCDKDSCTISCDPGDYITNGGCKSTKDVIREMDITNGILTCVSTDVSDTLEVYGLCWSNNGTFAQEITTC